MAGCPSSGDRFDFPAPRPWRLEGETIRDRDGGVVVSAINPANMETRSLIVRAVNERDRLRDIVRRLEDEYGQLEDVDTVCNTDRAKCIEALFREARAVLGEGADNA